jgi:hypothetical protein
MAMSLLWQPLNSRWWSRSRARGADAGDSAQGLIVSTDLLDHFFGVTDQQGAVRLELSLELEYPDRVPVSR